MGIRPLVTLMEQSIIDLLGEYQVSASARPGAPGVYVADRKVASVGLRVRRGCSFHGLSLNIDMDLEPFGRINPCGYPGLEVTQLSNLGGPVEVETVSDALRCQILERLGYNHDTRAKGPKHRRANPS
jgi:lipoyl(octanoyl) transferase